MITRCDFCDFTFCPDLPEDRAKHQALHRRTQAILAAHPGYEPSYERREAIKNDHPRNCSLDHLEDIIRAHWSRSLQAAGRHWRQHPGLDEYRRAWLAGERGFATEHPTIVAEAIAKHGAEISPHLPPGSSEWSRP